MKEYYYVTYVEPGSEFPTECAFDTFEEAETFALENGITDIYENGFMFEEWHLCKLCKTFVPWNEIDDGEICDKCADEFDRIERMSKKL